jgi:hypothetical protein
MVTVSALWQWAIVPGGAVWHAYADDAPKREVRGRMRRQAACGVWRHLGEGTYWLFVPTSRTCAECQLLWDERYVFRGVNQ